MAQATEEKTAQVTIPAQIRRFVEQSDDRIAKYMKVDILQYYSREDLRTYVLSRGYHLLEGKHEFFVIRDDYLRIIC